MLFIWTRTGIHAMHNILKTLHSFLKISYIDFNWDQILDIIYDQTECNTLRNAIPFFYSSAMQN